MTTNYRCSGGRVDCADINGFIARVEPFFEENGFYEKEIARRTEQFGNITHVWSIYACHAVALRRRESRHPSKRCNDVTV